MTEAPEIIQDLVEQFERNIEHYKDSSYKEEQLKHEFLNPFFKALGWDVYNESRAAPQYRDVIFEDSIKVAGGTTAPDYCFTLSGRKMFFLEAKKPSVNIKQDIHPAYQLRRYAWSAKLTVSILSDFEEFAVYESRKLPKKEDKASIERIKYLTYKDFIDEWDWIYSIFSKEAVLQGSFDRFIKSTRGKRGTQEVDVEFLKEMERWRLMLARNFALRNDWLSSRLLNYAVQLTIDRIIFLRICEDRGIEKYKQLHSLLDKENIYGELCKTYVKADEKYNSGLFHFTKEKGRGTLPDDLTLRLTLDDKVLKDLIKNLYYPDCPYEFSVLPPEILGNVYEQFLGKVIRLTPGHRAKVEDKPEVKKAGGVYYTPKYIVDYIVENTVGKLCKGKTPDQISKLRILDPACGSGSFLLGAYTYLLKYHQEYYSKLQNKKRLKDKIYPGRSGEWQLDIKEKKRILLNNIYGVDIDSQAVEVTKLSLLLKVLEGESRQLTLVQERALPDLGNNIKCGNSLVGTDFFKAQIAPDEEEIKRINPFDWGNEFEEIMNTGGFDVIIGNPPYVFGRDWNALGISNTLKCYLGNKFKSSPYQLDMFSIFMEKAYILSNNNGYIGQIVPNVWLTNTYSSVTRAFILNHAKDLVILTPPKNVFPGITVDTIVYTYRKSSQPGNTFQINKMEDNIILEMAAYGEKDFSDGKRPISTTLNKISSDLVYKLTANFPELKNFAKITRGVHPYRIGGYGKTAFGSGPQTSKDVNERPYHSKIKKNEYRPFIYGKDLDRFSPPIAREYVHYGPWLAEPRNPIFFNGVRVYSRKILGERLLVTVETTDSVADQQVYITLPLANNVDAKYLAGILGSKLIGFFIRGYYDEVNDEFPQIKVGQLKSIPIPSIDFSIPTDIINHDRMVSLVEQMLDLHKNLAKATISHEKQMIQRQINATDQQIDTLVYELYDLTEEEIKIVEESVK